MLTAEAPEGGRMLVEDDDRESFGPGPDVADVRVVFRGDRTMLRIVTQASVFFRYISGDPVAFARERVRRLGVRIWTMQLALDVGSRGGS